MEVLVVDSQPQSKEVLMDEVAPNTSDSVLPRRTGHLKVDRMEVSKVSVEVNDTIKELIGLENNRRIPSAKLGIPLSTDQMKNTQMKNANPQTPTFTVQRVLWADVPMEVDSQSRSDVSPDKMLNNDRVRETAQGSIGRKLFNKGKSCIILGSKVQENPMVFLSSGAKSRRSPSVFSRLPRHEGRVHHQNFEVGGRGGSIVQQPPLHIQQDYWRVKASRADKD